MHTSEQNALNQLTRLLETQPNSIGWQHLVSSPQLPHTPQERDRVLQVGTVGHQGNPGDPFLGWQRPWFFWLVLKLGLGLIALCWIMVYGCQLMLNTTTQVAVEMLYLVPPMVIPVVLMVFFWELNVPRNLSLWEVLACFLVGTILSMGGNALMFVLVGDGRGPFAALREEPAKLLAGVLLLLYFSKGKQKSICGLTGLVIGAAVGSGFSAFETISYGLHNDLQTVFIRVCFAVVGHTLYSCSYLAAVALHAPNGRISAQSFCNSDFLLTFGCSVLCHALWNTSEIPLWVRFPVTLVLLWYSALWITRKCLQEVWQRRHPTPVGRQPEPTTGTTYVELRCLRGPVAGQKWSFPRSQVVTIGRGSGNQICLPSGISGISRTHCYLEANSNGWVVTDAHSTYGTYLQLPGGSITKLVPGKSYRVTSGALLYLGSQSFCLGISLF